MSIYSGSNCLTAGPAGKSAYEYARGGGYTGTEEEFQELMGSVPDKAERFVVTFTTDSHRATTTADKTFAQIQEASSSGKIIEGHLAMQGYEGTLSVLPFMGIDASHAIFAYSGVAQGSENGKTVDYVILNQFKVTSDNVVSYDLVMTRIPPASTTAPLVAGTAAAGTSDYYAREDHVHPSEVFIFDPWDKDSWETSDIANAYLSGKLCYAVEHERNNSPYHNGILRMENIYMNGDIFQEALFAIDDDMTFQTEYLRIESDKTVSWSGGHLKRDYRPVSRLIVLPSSSWDSSALTQTVAVYDVSSNESSQLIQVMPASASMTAYNEAGIRCTAQAQDSLTFTCDTIPTEDVSVYVVIQEVNAE